MFSWIHDLPNRVVFVLFTVVAVAVRLACRPRLPDSLWWVLLLGAMINIASMDNPFGIQPDASHGLRNTLLQG